MLIQLLIIQIITFIALIFVLRFLSMRHLTVALNRLNALYDENLRRETQLTEELKRAQEEKEAEIRKGKEEAGALIEEAKKEAIKLRLKLEEEAKANVEKIIAQAKEETERLKEKLKQEIQNQSLDLAMKMIEQTFTEKDKEDLQHQFITEIIDEIAKLSQDEFTVSADKVKVVSSYPLEGGQREKLKRVLEERLGFSPILEETVNKELISGLTLEIGGLVIDGSLRNRLRRAHSL
jgi:F-type H+-transporting ATPase subunit b